MCTWVTNSKQILQNDLTCYKIIRKDLTAIFYDFQYELNKEYVTELGIPHQSEKISSFPRMIVKEGFHSFIEYEDAERNYNEINHTHSYLFVECIIPKGAEIYFNYINYLAVSNKIKIVKVIEKEKIKLDKEIIEELVVNRK